MVPDPQSDSELRSEELGEGRPTFFYQYEKDSRAFLFRLYAGGLGLLVFVAGAIYLLADREAVPAPVEVPPVVRAARVPGGAALTGALAKEEWAQALTMLTARREAGLAQAAELRREVELGLQLGALAPARAAWAELYRLDAMDARLEVWNALILLAEGKRDEAWQAASQVQWEALRESPALALRESLLVPLAQEDLAAGRLEQVLALLPTERVLGSKALFAIRQRALLALGRADEARQLLRRMDTWLDVPERRLAEGDIEMALGRPEEAEMYWRQSLGREARVQDLPLALAVAGRAAEHGLGALLIEVMDLVWFAAGGPAGDPKLWISYWSEAMRADDLASARRVARSLELQQPEDASWFHRRLRSEVMLGSVSPSALAELSARRESGPVSADLAVTEALVAWRLQRWPQAEQALAAAADAREAAGLTPSVSEVLARVLVARSQGRTEEAWLWRQRLYLDRLVPAERRWLGE